MEDLCKKRFFLKRVDGKWDEVDEFTAKHSGHAFLDFNGGGRRYSDVAVEILPNGAIEIHGQILAVDLQWIMRFIGVTPLSPDSKIPGGMLNEPEHVVFMIKGRKTIHQINGPTFIEKKKAA